MLALKSLLLSLSLAAAGMARPGFQPVKSREASPFLDLAVQGAEVYGIFDRVDVYRTRDFGASWRRIPPAGSGKELFATGGAIYAQKAFSPVLLDSEKNTLVTLSKEEPRFLGTSTVTHLLDAGSRFYSVAIVSHPEFPRSQLLGTVPKQGTTWEFPSNINFDANGSIMGIAASDDTVVIILGSKVRCSRNAGSFWTLVSTIPADTVLTMDRFSGGYLTATEKGLFAARNPLEPWQPLGLSERVLPQAISGDNLVVWNGRGQYQLSTDAGRKWSTISLPLPEADIMLTEISDSLLCFMGSGLAYCSLLSEVPVSVGKPVSRAGDGPGLAFSGGRLVLAAPSGTGSSRSGSLKLWDLRGNLVWDRGWRLQAHEKEVRFEVTHWRPGLYLGVITAEGRSFSTKVNVL